MHTLRPCSLMTARSVAVQEALLFRKGGKRLRPTFSSHTPPCL